jgi:hypothetical protein
MTASRPDMRVLAGGDSIADWLANGGPALDGTPVLVVVPNDLAATLRPEAERDLCSPGFVVAVVTALAEAGIGKAGGPGIELLAARGNRWRDAFNRVRVAVGMDESSLADPHDVGVAATLQRVRSAVSRANALAQAVQSIGQTLGDAARDAKAVPESVDGDYLRMDVLRIACEAVSDLVESVAADVVAPTQTAREVLAAHGWREGMFPNRIGKPQHNWVNNDGDRFAWVGDGSAMLDGEPSPPAVLRAFAQLAEESQP